MIKAILFDFGLVISAPCPPARFRQYESQLGIAKGTINRIMFDSPAWRDTLPEPAAVRVVVIGINPDPVAQQNKFDDAHGLGFPLLSDSGHHKIKSACRPGTSPRMR